MSIGSGNHLLPAPTVPLAFMSTLNEIRIVSLAPSLLSSLSQGFSAFPSACLLISPNFLSISFYFVPVSSFIPPMEPADFSPMRILLPLAPLPSSISRAIALILIPRTAFLGFHLGYRRPEVEGIDVICNQGRRNARPAGGRTSAYRRGSRGAGRRAGVGGGGSGTGRRRARAVGGNAGGDRGRRAR